MSDSALLRLARIVADAIEGEVSEKILVLQCEQIIRDLEAAPQPAPARRTITREEFRGVCECLESWATMPPETVAHVVARQWRLTVEDA